MKRNKIALAGIALLVAGGLALAGCSSSGSGSPSASGGDSTAIIKTNGSEPENPLIPTNTNEVGGGKILDEIFAGLVYYDAKGEPQNDMAESITVDGVPAAKVTGKILVTGPNLTVAGDDVTVIVIASAPQTYAMLVIPIGRDDMAATGKAIVEQLKVAKDV